MKQKSVTSGHLKLALASLRPSAYHIGIGPFTTVASTHWTVCSWCVSDSAPLKIICLMYRLLGSTQEILAVPLLPLLLCFSLFVTHDVFWNGVCACIKRSPRALVSPSARHHLWSRQNPYWIMNLLMPWSWTFWPLELWAINSCYLQSTHSKVFYDNNSAGLRQKLVPGSGMPLYQMPKKEEITLELGNGKHWNVLRYNAMKGT